MYLSEHDAAKTALQQITEMVKDRGVSYNIQEYISLSVLFITFTFV